ncbi:interferon-related developmental regulator 1-like [Centruroides sculpturatus]|uniref:interferon-related developmental regulator 1-like n=1 Tax=Centruroides sculpturatus TaxID=218467 RepID=UPI000C6EF309|nr:interferon-related developmental regulator 1-like [Centruroides sculpturatus]
MALNYVMQCGNFHPKIETNLLNSEEESNIDNASVISVASDSRYGSDDGTWGEPEIEESPIYDDFEEKLKEAIDGTNQKSAKGRQVCLEAVRKALSTRYMCDFIVERKITVCDMLERSLKRGKGDEQGSAALLTASICIQLGVGSDSEEIFLELQPYLVKVLLDPTALPETRQKCATALGVCCFITDVGGDIVFTFSHLKRLPELLESSDLELRIAAGECIAIFYELIREYKNDYEGENITDLCNKLHDLATDCHKSRAKKDRRQQRSSFRDILKAVENGETPDIRIKFGRETLYIDSWCRKHQYDAFCQLLGSGMNLHLSVNELMRDIFELGPLIDTGLTPKISKMERNVANAAACKARTRTRGKLRDKRADVIR